MSLTTFSFSQKKIFKYDPNQFSDSLRKNKEAQLLDLRTQKEYETGSIKKSVNIDLNSTDFDERIEKRFNKKKPLFVYCQTGIVSTQSVEYLIDMGFNTIYVLNGGFENWTLKSKPYQASPNVFRPLAYITDENFAKKIKSNEWVLVDFYADWCKPCKKMAPILEKIDSDLIKLNLVKIDADKNTTLTQKHEIDEIPTLLLFKNGRQIWKHVGEITEKEILDIIN
jgi:thioredoxin